jgi:hypothetical protein
LTILDQKDQNGQFVKATLFYADILGFSEMSARPGARRALEQLSDIARLLSSEDSLARYLQRPIWRARYGLSDSIFLVGDDPVEVSAATAEFFFNLAFYNASQGMPVLIRGAITFGEIRETEAVFPETARKNLVGEAVVRAVNLEKSGIKGPRLLISKEVAGTLKRSKLKPLMDTTAEAETELLWPLPPDISLANEHLIGDVVSRAVRLALDAHRGRKSFDHYLAYLDLCLRSLLRLKRHSPKAAHAITREVIESRRSALDRLFARAEYTGSRRVLDNLMSR